MYPHFSKHQGSYLFLGHYQNFDLFYYHASRFIIIIIENPKETHCWISTDQYSENVHPAIIEALKRANQSFLPLQSFPLWE